MGESCVAGYMCCVKLPKNSDSKKCSASDSSQTGQFWYVPKRKFRLGAEMKACIVYICPALQANHIDKGRKDIACTSAVPTRASEFLESSRSAAEYPSPRAAL